MILNIQNLKIIECFLANYNSSFTASTIASKYGFNQKSVSNFLNSLETENFLISKFEGRNRLFSLNLYNSSIIHFLSLIEHYKVTTFYKKNPLVKEISLKILEVSDGIVIIFGSYAKERHKPDSDLDIFIIGKYDEDKVNKISEMYKKDINIKNYPFNIFKKALKTHDPLIEEVIKNHIILKGVQEFVENLKVKYYGKD